MKLRRQLHFCLFFIIFLSLVVTTVMAGFSGRMPTSGVTNGMVLEYRVDGAEIESYDPDHSAYLGTLTPGARTLTVSGTAYMDDHYTYWGETVTGKFPADVYISMSRTSGGTGDGVKVCKKRSVLSPALPGKPLSRYQRADPRFCLDRRGFFY